jgi:hypothetical protein
MSAANTFEPTTDLSPNEIATFAKAMRNHPLPKGLHVERTPAGHTNSPNEAGGYIGLAAIARDSTLIKR